MKIDPYNHKERYLTWKEKVKDGIPELSKSNSIIILHFLDNMENGINIANGSKKGGRSYIRLNSLKERLIFMAKLIKNKFNVDLLNISEEQLITFFTEMRNGKLTKSNGENYKSVADYVKIFKTFWHWHIKASRKLKKQVEDITVDLDTKQEKPAWVYLTEQEIYKLCNHAKYEYKVLIMFLFDTGIRAPTELINIKVSDLYFDKDTELNIREEISKTFGRRIKLMLCSDALKDYIKNKNLTKEDYLFPICPSVVNRYLNRLGERVLGDKQSPARQRYSELTMYDFRHNSCCYWLPRYKSESALKYRFGWKGSDKIHYYSELLGMKDTISEEDLFISSSKTEVDKKLEKSERERIILQERIDDMEKQMRKILDLTNELHKKVD